MTPALFVGMVVSLVLTEFTGYSPGGIIVAGYLVQFIAQPVWFGGTVAAALLTYGLVAAVERRLLLYGRRQFAIYILVGVLISQLAMRLNMGGAFSDTGFLVIGYLVPGLVARDFARQGMVTTLLATALAVVITQIVLAAGEGVLW